MPTIVQFIHPGQEAKPDNSGHVQWNPASNPHKRKFAVNGGVYLDSFTTAPQKSDDMIFWCEWEPASTLHTTLSKPTSEYPQYLYQLWWASRKKYSYLHNTDPFIFEQPFKYSSCKQAAYPSLQSLDPGSLVLFGSNLRGKFVLDTMFVVESGAPYNLGSYSGVSLSATFECVSIRPLVDSVPSPHSHNFFLYNGVTYAHRQNYQGMFSFFPCLPAKGQIGFARPQIQRHGIISQSLKQGIKITPAPMKICVEVWNDIVSQITNSPNKLSLGIEATMPIASGTSSALPTNGTSTC